MKNLRQVPFKRVPRLTIKSLVGLFDISNEFSRFKKY